MSRPRTSPDPARTGPGAPETPGSDGGRSGTAIGEAVRRVFAPRLASRAGSRIWERWRRTLRLLRPLGAVSYGNALRLLDSGDEAFETMWSAIAAARVSVLVNTYTIEDDTVGRRTRDELVAAAGRGCRVLVIYDSIGSAALDDDFLAPLREAGVAVLAFNPVLRFRTRFSRLIRNHRKILVVDDSVAFTGGMNFSCDYAGSRYGNGLFKDTQIRIEGPAAVDLAEMVLATEAELVGTAPPSGTPAAPREGGSLVQVLASNERRGLRAIQRALQHTLVRASERCYLTSPYFVPPGRLMRRMSLAARRGVDVRVLTAGKSDVPLVHLASQHLYGRLLRAGVRIWEMERRTLHSKTATIDGVYGSVGSFNLDYWSYRRNLEVTVTALDEGVAAELESRFRSDLGLAREVKLETWQRRNLAERALHWIAYRIARL